MRIAVLGASGQLGGELCLRLGAQAVPLSHADLDICNADQVQFVLNEVRPDAVVNCAAYNGVDLAETEPEAAFRGNALGPRCLAVYASAADVPLVHVSTDYVYGLDQQRDTPFRETDLTGPVGAYGISKLAGEEFVRAGCRRHFILRTCGLYGRHAKSGKRNFVETMLRLGNEREELRVVSDQRCTPTATLDLAEMIVDLLKTEHYGTYHATNSGDCSWSEFATEIFRLADLKTRVIPISSAEYGAKARRPGYSVLANSKLSEVLGRSLQPWQEALAEYISGVAR